MAGAVTYTTVANHLATAVSELPDFLARNRNVSGINAAAAAAGGGSNFGPGPHHGIYNKDNTVHTGHHPTWSLMTADERKAVNDERARLGLGRNQKKKQGNARFNKNKTRVGQSKNNANQLRQLKAANTKHKRTIATL